MKRWLSFFMAFLMLFSFVSCATVQEPEDTQAQTAEGNVSASDETEEEEETDFFPNIERNDYKKEVFRRIPPICKTIDSLIFSRRLLLQILI